MIKRIVLVFGGLALVASLFPAYLIGVSFGFWQPLTRLSGVSARARYVDITHLRAPLGSTAR